MSHAKNIEYKKEGTDDRKSVNTCNLSSSGWWLEARGQLSGAGNKGARRGRAQEDGV